MFGPPPSPEEEVKELPRARTLGVIIATSYFVFVAIYLLLWEHVPDWQLILNRISWSSSDFIGLAATGLALYSYDLFQKYSKNKDIIYLQKFVLELKKAGIEPSDIRSALTALKPLFSEVGNDPEFQAKLQGALARVTKEQIQRLKRLDSEELYELLRSGRGLL